MNAWVPSSGSGREWRGGATDVEDNVGDGERLVWDGEVDVCRPARNRVDGACEGFFADDRRPGETGKEDPAEEALGFDVDLGDGRAVLFGFHGEGVVECADVSGGVLCCRDCQSRQVRQLDCWGCHLNLSFLFQNSIQRGTGLSRVKSPSTRRLTDIR